MSLFGTASPPLWGRSSENGCISNSEKRNLDFSCPMPTGEDGHTGESAAGACPTGTKPPSSCSRHMRAFGAGWSGNAGTTALTSKASVSEGLSRSFTASTRRRRPLLSAAAITQARKCKSFRAIFLQRGLARGDHANHSHARQQGQGHRPMSDGADGLCKESG